MIDCLVERVESVRISFFFTVFLNGCRLTVLVLAFWLRPFWCSFWMNWYFVKRLQNTGGFRIQLFFLQTCLLTEKNRFFYHINMKFDYYYMIAMILRVAFKTEIGLVSSLSACHQDLMNWNLIGVENKTLRLFND